MAASSVWGALQAFGESVLQLECANKLDLEVREDEKITVEKDARVSMDGLFVNIREEGWKELKVGSVFTFSAQTSLRMNKQGELIQEVKANTQTYVSHLGGPEGIGMKVENETQRRDWFRARQQAVVGDGANWIWKQAELYFPDSAHIVDWYHAKQHLSAAADNLYPTQPERKATWLEAAAEKLYNGQQKGLHVKCAKVRARKTQVILMKIMNGCNIVTFSRLLYPLATEQSKLRLNCIKAVSQEQGCGGLVMGCNIFCHFVILSLVLDLMLYGSCYAPRKKCTLRQF